MSRYYFAIFWACCILACMAGQPENLVRNSGFEKGSDERPADWSGVDGLTVTWGRNGNPGRCVVFDTSVQQKDKKAYQEDPKKYTGPSQKRQYASVGAHEGVWVFSQPIDLRDDDEYFIITADVKSSVGGGPFVLIRGFQLVTEETAGRNNSIFQIPHPGGPAYSEQFGPESQRRDSKAGDYLQSWRHTLVCRLDAPGKWEHFEMGFNLPKDKRFRPQRLWLKPYAYWPEGIYEFDNVTLRRATKEEVATVNSKRKSVLKKEKK
ncbi:MAG: hypothetical protein GX902_08555 [Lentisphaerae bacterium]|nr:hypothetical protein [Lentisphaerota bacterium]